MTTLTTVTAALPQDQSLDNTRYALRTLVLLPLLMSALLGILVFYGVAFADSPLAHNAAHDVRHITVKPCH